MYVVCTGNGYKINKHVYAEHTFFRLRYYNTTERMTGLFGKITDQMIVNCKDCITGKDTMDALWEKVRSWPRNVLLYHKFYAVALGHTVGFELLDNYVTTSFRSEYYMI